MTIEGDPFSITMDRNFGAGGRRSTLSITSSTSSHTHWNDLHRYVLRQGYLDAAKHRAVIVCNLVSDVAHLDWGKAGNVLLLAMREKRGAECTESFRSRREMIGNLGDPCWLAQVEEALPDEGPYLFVIGDVLEQLGDPRPLLRVVRKLLKRHGESRLVTETRERHRAGNAPTDPRFRRSWTRDEFARFWSASGFEVLYTEQADGTLGIVVEVGCEREYYDRFLQTHRLPPASSRLLLISTDTDHPEIDNIERYVVELGRLGDELPIVLTVGGPFLDAISKVSIRAESLAEWHEPWTAPDSILEPVLQVIFLYDEVRQIEFPDYGGLFLRVPQAKRAGLIPPAITCLVICHGSNFYVERVTKELQCAPRNIRHLWEKIAIELADVLLFPTEHMRWLYLDQLGLRPLGSTVVQGFPYTWAGSAWAPSIAGGIDTLGFLGDQRRTNGWSEFCQAVGQLFSDEKARGTLGLRRVVILGSRAGGAPIALPPHVQLEEIDPPPDALFAMLTDLSARSLIVIARPHTGYPYPLLQALDANCPVLAMKGGGVEELLPIRFREEVFCEPQPRDLHQALRRVLEQVPSMRSELTASLKQALHSQKQQSNAAWRKLHVSKPTLLDLSQLEPSPVTVVVPVYNRPFAEIEDMIIGLNSQILQPYETIFIDDTSREDFGALYGERIRSLLRSPARFIRHTHNMGLAGARNTGFQACVTKFVAVHDTDNVAANDFLYRGCIALLANPQLDAVNFYLRRFYHGDDWTQFDSKVRPYCPLGDGLIESLGHVNWLGDAMGLYRVSTLRDLGGWDETDRAMWEDLALFLHMLASNRRLMCIPQCEALYRIRSDSMLRTGSEYDARQRMARFLRSLATFDALCIQRLVSDWGQQQRVIKYSTPRHLLVAAVRQYLADKPILLTCARVCFAFVRRSRAMLRSLL